MFDLFIMTCMIGPSVSQVWKLYRTVSGWYTRWVSYHSEGAQQGGVMSWSDLNKGNCQVLPMGRNNSLHQYMLGRNQLESSFAEKDLGILVETKFNMSWQYVSGAKKGYSIMDCLLYIWQKYSAWIQKWKVSYVNHITCKITLVRLFCSGQNK